MSEALFNFANAWSMTMLPVMLSEASEALPSGKESGYVNNAEKEKYSSSNAFKWWLGVQFLTNVFMIPYMALVSVLERGKERERVREREREQTAVEESVGSGK